MGDRTKAVVEGAGHGFTLAIISEGMVHVMELSFLPLIACGVVGVSLYGGFLVIRLKKLNSGDADALKKIGFIVER